MPDLGVLNRLARGLNVLCPSRVAADLNLQLLVVFDLIGLEPVQRGSVKLIAPDILAIRAPKKPTMIYAGMIR